MDKDLEQIRNWPERSRIDRLRRELDKKGLSYFVVVSDPKNPTLGTSIYNGRGDKQSAAYNARDAHMKWEQQRGISATHDWRKEASELLRGGLADGKSPRQFNRVELKHGISVEKEHTSSTQKAKEIAMDHLTEHPHYYQALQKMENKLEKSEKKAGGTMSRLDWYLAKRAAEEKKDEKKKEDKKEDKKESGSSEKKESGSSEKKQEGPPPEASQDPNASAPPPAGGPGVPPGMPPAGPVAAPPQMGAGMPPMAAAMPTPMSPVDVMGQGLQQTTQGVNQMIDAFYALQGGAPSAAPMPAAAGAAAAVPGDPTGQGSMPQAPQAPVDPAAAQAPQQKVAGQVPGGYSCTDSSKGAQYYSFLRSRIEQSNAIVNGRQPGAR